MMENKTIPLLYAVVFIVVIIVLWVIGYYLQNAHKQTELPNKPFYEMDKKKDRKNNFKGGNDMKGAYVLIFNY